MVALIYTYISLVWVLGSLVVGRMLLLGGGGGGGVLLLLLLGGGWCLVHNVVVSLLKLLTAPSAEYDQLNTLLTNITHYCSLCFSLSLSHSLSRSVWYIPLFYGHLFSPPFSPPPPSFSPPTTQHTIGQSFS